LFVIPEALGGHRELLVPSGDDASAGLDHDFVILDALEEIFEFGGEAGSDFTALLGDREVSRDVATGVAPRPERFTRRLSVDTLAR
jgi:hypothetical protein